ncbi:MAG: hypothetical protein CM1200mP41_17540 [Gammaproteobacteria bacterium]|nr:MAG: hypothetical protein CM1200mP41_17540 [Gammaproteobacteria bacterium]
MTELVLDKMPVSISLGLWTTLLVYLISIPLGIRKAIRDGSRFDSGPERHHSWHRDSLVFVRRFLLVIFAGGSYWTGSRWPKLPARTGIACPGLPALSTISGTWHCRGWP